MIIGISGKINSGKDLVGKIIMDLTSKQECWQIKKFADPLKDIVCILLNCTREQLEDREFKEKELGKEWDKREFSFIEGTTQTHTSFNDADKEDFKAKYPISYKENIIHLTPRRLLQLLGTECGRNIIHPNIWVNATLANYKPFIENYPNIIKSNGKDLVEGKYYSMGKAVYPSWCITDVRFPNEADAIKNRDGLIIRIERGQYDPKCKICGLKASEHNAHHPFIKKIEHESETALDNYEFDYIIENNGTKEELQNAIRNILIKESIIT